MPTLAENVLAAGAKNRPPMLEKARYDTWQSRMLLYIEAKEHGQMFLNSILHGLFQFKVVTFLANEAMGVAAEKTLLAQQQGAGIEITDEQQDFLAEGLEGFDLDCEEIQLNATFILMTKKVDAYHLEVDDAPTANSIFMARLSHVGSINKDDVGPSYD
uniref:Ribonuclease H-like domain-containing protein n=1 Tax=Tanacetum cinerariifolium TaxID=118510 RepID=A0A699I911_TANCI|nr:ribonuclease H-like domain-containing protein [Tanacetum cinerariifolium]